MPRSVRKEAGVRRKHLELDNPLLAETQVHTVCVLHKIKVVRGKQRVAN